MEEEKSWIDGGKDTNNFEEIHCKEDEAWHYEFAGKCALRNHWKCAL